MPHFCCYFGFTFYSIRLSYYLIICVQLFCFVFASGLVREVGIQLFHVDTKPRVLSVETLVDDPRGYKEHAVIEVFMNTQKNQDERALPKSSCLEDEVVCPFRECSISELVISSSSFHKAVPYHLIVDEDFMILGCGNAMQKVLCRGNFKDRHINSLFKLIDPEVEFSYAEIVRQLNEPFTLAHYQNTGNNDTQQITFKGKFNIFERMSQTVLLVISTWSTMVRLWKITCLSRNLNI